MPHLSRVSVHGTEVIAPQFGIILDDLVFSFTGGQPSENFPDDYPQAPDASWPERFPGSLVNARDVHGFHNPILLLLNARCVCRSLGLGHKLLAGFIALFVRRALS